MREWLRRPLVVTNASALRFGLVIGVLCAAGIVLGKLALDQAQAGNRRARAAERLTTGDVRKIAQRVFAIERPGKVELRRRFLVELRACARDRRCRRLFAERAPAGVRLVPLPPSSGSGLSRPTTGHGVAPSVSGPRGHRGRPGHNGGPGPGPPPPVPTVPAPPPPPSAPQVCVPVVNVCVPLPSLRPLGVLVG